MACPILVVKSSPVTDVFKQHLPFASLRFLINYCFSSTINRCVSHCILKTYWACHYLHWKTHRNKSASVPMSWSPFFLMIPLIEYDCMNSLTLLDCSMTRKGWSPLGRQSPQCSWLDLIWFPSSINPTLEYAVFLYGSCISLTEVWLQPYPATLQQVVNTIRCTALLHSSWWF